MPINIDSKERIARSNIYSIFGKLLNQLIENNEDGEVLLKKAGLSSFWEEYGNLLSPHCFYKGYRNNNDGYNPEYACMCICEQIESDVDALLRFVNCIFEKIHSIDDKQFDSLSNYLEVLGYELLVKTEVDEEYDIETNYYSLVPGTKGVAQRNSDITYLRSMLVTHHLDLVILYDEAVSNFGSGQYVSCIENCRSLFESFFKKLDVANNDYVKGILSATGETIVDNGAQLTSIKKIYTYWLDNKKGANRFRLFQTMYSAMSGLGTHHEDVATKEDALLLLRYVEDCLLWCFRKGINC